MGVSKIESIYQTCIPTIILLQYFTKYYHMTKKESDSLPSEIESFISYYISILILTDGEIKKTFI